MADLEPQDPALAPDAEPTLGDEPSELAPSQNEASEDAKKKSSIDDDDHDDHPSSSSSDKVLEVKHQPVKDALGNVGDFTGSINVATNFPHGQGEMIYSLSTAQSDNDNDSADPAAVMTLVASHKGSWEHGHWQGHGTQTLSTGDTFSGDFDKSRRKFGEYRWKETEQSNGAILIRKQRCYQGDFDEHGRPHGHGKYTWTTIKVTERAENGGADEGKVDQSANNGGTEGSASSTKSVSTYVGMFENSKRHGHGVFTSSTLQYTGDWALGQYHGYGVLKLPGKKSTYRGQFHHGKRDGKGAEVLDDGTVIHDGLWRQDRPIKQEDNLMSESLTADEDGKIASEGHKSSLPASTVFQTPQEIVDGENVRGMYKGIVEDGLPSGVGTITYERNHHPAGIVEYEGFFDQGIRQGYGRASFGNGGSFHGNWSNGVFEGNGEYIFGDGRCYTGMWTKGLPHDAKGRFVWSNNDFYEGVYENGHRKSGRFVFADGSYYLGECFSPDGSYGGHGKLVTLMVSYEGGFRDGAFHGKGCLRKNCGSVVFDGEWKDGKAVRDDVLIAIPADLLNVPLPPPDDDFGEFEDGPQDLGILSTLKRTISPTPCVPGASDRPSLSISETIMGTSSKLLGSLTSNFSGMGFSEDTRKTQDECKAVVDMAVSDAQDNPGRYTGILHVDSQRPHGVGRMVYDDGNRIHEGFWSHGNRHGEGRCLFTKVGDFHEGMYSANLRHGAGKYFWSDGRQFVGTYVEDQRSGFGKLTYPDGSVYEGNFEHGSRSGYGVFTFSQKTCEYRGEWEKSSYNGNGRLQWKTDAGIHVYEGDFMGGKFHGQGVETINGVLKRKGHWDNGTYHYEDIDLLSADDGEERQDSTNETEEDAEESQHAIEAIQQAPSKDECPTSLEQDYSDVRLQWKRSLEPANA